MTSRNLTSLLAQEVQGHPEAPEFKGKDYFDQFKRLDEYMNAHIHPPQAVGAALTDDVWLNDHGPDHVATVIQRASHLVIEESGKCVLTPYESYILLCAIHFHDVGNFLGREDHEKRVVDVMLGMDASLIGDNSIEKRMIRDIATAHGGIVDGTKDTIGQLTYERGKDGPRVQLLAAILRFADELADDHSRTSRFLITQATTALVFAGSEVYHQYSDRLREVKIQLDEDVVKLFFELDAEMIGQRYQKGTDQVFLFDEILLRSLKLHHEHVYCSRYMRPWIYVERILVHIGIFKNDYMQKVGHLEFTMQESGYPATPETIGKLCSNLAGVSGDTFSDRSRDWWYKT